MDAKQTILTCQLPKTGMLPLTPPVKGDDASHHAGWWKGRDYDTNKTRFIIKGEGLNRITIDRATGLMWAADGNGEGCNLGNTIEWVWAVSHCRTLNLAGFDDWRLPNINELFSIVNFARISPAIYTAFFPNTVSGHYWSSTTYMNVTINAWHTNFNTGELSLSLKTESKYLRCVRGGL